MKKIRLFILIAILLSFSSADAFEFSLGVNVGYNHYLSDDTEDFDALLVGVGAEYFMGDLPIRLASQFSYAEGREEDTRAALSTLRLSARYLTLRDNRWVPYVGGGLNLYSFRMRDSGWDDSSFEFGFCGLAGVYFDYNTKWYLYGEVSFNTLSSDVNDIVGDVEANHLEVVFGFQYRFGKKKAEW